MVSLLTLGSIKRCLGVVQCLQTLRFKALLFASADCERVPRPCEGVGRGVGMHARACVRVRVCVCGGGKRDIGETETRACLRVCVCVCVCV